VSAPSATGRGHVPPWSRPRRRGRTTREGWAFVFVTIGVGVAAVNTGNNLLYLMLGLMLSLLLLSMVLSELTLRSIRVERRLPRRAFAGRLCLVELMLVNRKRWMPSYSLEVEDVAAGAPTERRCYFLKIGPSSEQLASYRRTPERRGVLELTGFRIATRYPFGLIEKSHHYDHLDALLVYPELVPVDAARLTAGIEGADYPAGRVGPGTEIADLRAYRPGDEARAIHWRRTATLGRIVVRERERDVATRLTLALDNARPEGADETWDEGFEQAIREAASLASAALGRGTAVEVVSRGAGSPIVLPGGPPDPILRFLALLQAVPMETAPPFHAILGPVRRIAVVPVEGAA